VHVAEEVFAKGIFKALSYIISAITRIFPFSLAEALLFALPVGFLVVVAAWMTRLVTRKGDRGFRMADGVLNVLVAAGFAVLLFVLGCGVNYYRRPFAHYAGFEVVGSTKEELHDLCVYLAEQAGIAREGLPAERENDEGVYKLDVSIRELGKRARDSFGTLSEIYPVFSRLIKCPLPKPIYFSHQLSKTGITGIFMPFTMEANVNVDIPDYSIASTMCHELAHLHGFIREDEANYISYLACIHSGDVDLMYGGYMEALIIAGNALYGRDSELYYLVRDTYTDGMVRDMADNSRYWKQFEDEKVGEIAEKVNDAYLKANNQADGIQSYGRMVDLLLAEHRQRKGSLEW